MPPRQAAKSSLEHQAPHATRRIEGTIPVRAVQRGYYDEHIKEPGAEFMIRTKEELGSWMELVEEETAAAEQSATGEPPKVEPPKVEPPKPAATPKAKPAAKGTPEPTPAPQPGNDVL